MKKDDTKTPQDPTSKRRDESTKTVTDNTKGLDFSKLDLTVERVDERLSPSETNIFDK